MSVGIQPVLEKKAHKTSYFFRISFFSNTMVQRYKEYILANAEN